MLGGCESCLLMLWQGRKLLVLCTTNCKAVAVLREWMWGLSVDVVTGQEAVSTVYDQLQGRGHATWVDVRVVCWCCDRAGSCWYCVRPAARMCYVRCRCWVSLQSSFTCPTSLVQSTCLPVWTTWQRSHHVRWTKYDAGPAPVKSTLFSVVCLVVVVRYSSLTWTCWECFYHSLFLM